MVVGIIGVLAAVAIPAYQRYQRNAEIGVVQSTINQIRKSFQICMSVSDLTSCRKSNVDGTIELGSEITLSPSDPSGTKTCWKLEKGSEFTGCVAFDGRSYVNKEIGYPSDTTCSDIDPTCDGSGNVTCAGGCTASGSSCTGGTPYVLPADADCGSGNTTSKTTASCASGVCSSS